MHECVHVMYICHACHDVRHYYYFHDMNLINWCHLMIFMEEVAVLQYL